MVKGIKMLLNTAWGNFLKGKKSKIKNWNLLQRELKQLKTDLQNTIIEIKR